MVPEYQDVSYGIAVYIMRPCFSVEVDDIYVLKTSALPIVGNTKPATAT